MSADITEERIAEIRSMPHDNWRIVHELLDALLSARSQLAALQSVPQGVEVPERAAWLTIEEIAAVVEAGAADYRMALLRSQALHIARLIASASMDKGARLVPTPPQAAPGAVVEIPEPTGISFFADGRDSERRRRDVLQGIQWARLNARIVYPATCKDSLQVPHPLQPEERRVGPDEVVVPRSAAEYAILAFDWIECPDPEHYEALRAFYDALRTSAQDHNGEGANHGKL